MIKINKTLFIIGIIFVIIMSIFFTIMDNKHINILNKEYSICLADAKNENALIIEKRDWHGTYFIKLSNGNKYWVPDSRNYDYEEYDIEDYLVNGNIIVKKRGIDSLLIITPEGKFVFIISKHINKNKR